MSGLKEIKNRIKSVKSSQKITQAMKMVAAAKFRRAKTKLDCARPNFHDAQNVLEVLCASIENGASFKEKEVIFGKENDDCRLLVVLSSDRGLCGAFNSALVKTLKNRHEILESDGKKVKIITIGKKSYDIIKSNAILSSKVIANFDRSDENRKLADYDFASLITHHILEMFQKNKIDSCEIIYNNFVSALSQNVESKYLLPLDKNYYENEEQEKIKHSNVFEFEPSSKDVLARYATQMIKFRIFEAMVESDTSEHGLRMTAMDNASRNAGEMIKDLTLQYNRTRQAVITKELIEIISGADAVK